MSSSKQSFADTLRVVFSGRMLVAFAMGFASGLPLLLTITLLQAWLKDEQVDLGTIGLFALVQLPYTLKFLWAPLMDRYKLPFLGRRRGWMLVVQVALMLSILALGLTEPATNPWLVALCALAVTFFSASQDIVIDAYRREALADVELGLGASLAVNGYRVGMLVAGGGGLILADLMPFEQVFMLFAAMMLVGMVTTLLAPEPPQAAGSPRTLKAAVVEPFIEYFRRDNALWILAFILLYKLGETMAMAMTTPFYLELGYTKTEIGAVVKLFGFWATVLGGLLGGVLMLRIGIYRALLWFGVLQALATTGFAVLAWMGPGTGVAMLALVIAGENLSGGAGTSAYVGFMASITDKRFTATQYALLSSMMGIPRVLASAPTGYMAEALGWFWFFAVCVLITAPGILILRHFRGWGSERVAA